MNSTWSTLPWLVFTRERSGSRWFVDTLSERSGGLVFKTSEIRACGRGCACEDAGHGDEMAILTCVQTLVLRHDSPSGSCPSTPCCFRCARAGSVQTRRCLIMCLIFMWQRNDELRRLISTAANQPQRNRSRHCGPTPAYSVYEHGSKFMWNT